MKKSDIFKATRAEKFDTLSALIAKGTTENRAFTPEETTQRNALVAEIEKLDADIAMELRTEAILAAQAGAEIGKGQKEEEKRLAKRYSLLRAINLRADGKQLDGVELEMHQEGEKEYRALGQSVSGFAVPSMIVRGMTATGQTSVAGDQGGNTIAKEVMPLLSGLKAKQTLAKLGATYLTGLTGNVAFPKAGNASAVWATENGTATETSPTTAEIVMTPKRLAAFMSLSKQLLNQSSSDIEAWAQNELALCIALAVEDAAINGPGTGNAPKGLLAWSGLGSVVGGTNGAAPTWAHIVALETAVSTANADMNTLNYLTNPKVRGKLKTTSKTGTEAIMVWDNSTQPLNGYGAGVTTLVPSNKDKGTSTGVCSSIIYGDFSELFIGQWLGLDIVVDPYTLAANNQVKLTVNSLWDVMVRRHEAFAVMLDALTA